MSLPPLLIIGVSVSVGSSVRTCPEPTWTALGLMTAWFAFGLPSLRTHTGRLVAAVAFSLAAGSLVLPTLAAIDEPGPSVAVLRMRRSAGLFFVAGAERAPAIVRFHPGWRGPAPAGVPASGAQWAPPRPAAAMRS